MRRLPLIAFLAIFAISSSLFAQSARPARSGANPTSPSLASAGPALLVHFHLDGTVSETPSSDLFQLGQGEASSLKKMIEQLDRAAADPEVKGIVLTWNSMQIGLAQAEELSAAFARVKEAGKPVIVHLAGEAMSISLNTYAMLASASSISVEPGSDLWLTGLYGEQVYLKSMLEKLGVKADWLHMGAYKSAGEMFTNSAPSPEADKMMNWLFDSLYGGLVDAVAKGRGIDSAAVRARIDKGPVVADEALKEKLLDKVEFYDEFVAGLKKQFGPEVLIEEHYGKEESPKVDLSNPFAIMQIFSQLGKQAAPEKKGIVAVIYVDGMIQAGHGESNPLGSSAGMVYGEDLRYWLEKAAADPNVGAVVLRVDSPGGSALGSEQIWRGTQVVRKSKPLVVSMGDVAGSGGYYCSCGADEIFADRATLTASIGVVGGKFVTTELWNKLGVDWVPYKRGANADLFASSEAFTTDQRAWFEGWMNEVYGRFQKRVADGRGAKLKLPMDELNGGRVFTGEQAKEKGLIDSIGGLHEAIAEAAKLAKLDKFDAEVYPAPKDFLTQLIDEISGVGEDTTDLQIPAGSQTPSAKLSFPGLAPGGDASISALLPMLGTIDPARAAAIRKAMISLTLLRGEGIALVMPFELVIH